MFLFVEVHPQHDPNTYGDLYEVADLAEAMRTVERLEIANHARVEWVLIEGAPVAQSNDPTILDPLP